MSKRILIAIVAFVLTTIASWGYGNVERIVNVKDPATAKLYERFFASQQQKPDRGEKTMDKKSGVRHENDGEDETTSTITLHYTMPEGYRLNTIIVYYEEYYQI